MKLKILFEQSYYVGDPCPIRILSQSWVQMLQSGMQPYSLYNCGLLRITLQGKIHSKYTGDLPSESGLLCKWNAVKIKMWSTTCDLPLHPESLTVSSFQMFQSEPTCLVSETFIIDPTVMSDTAGGGKLCLSMRPDNNECCVYIFGICLFMTANTLGGIVLYSKDKRFDFWRRL